MTETVRGILERQAERLGNRPFAVLPDVTLTYSEADRLAARTANALAGLGYGPGDVVMAMCPNGGAMLATWFGCIKLGAVFAPVNALLSGEPLRTVIGHARSRVIVCHVSLLPVLESIRPRLPELRHVLVTPGSAGRDTLPFDRLIEDAPSTAPPPLSGGAAAAAKLMYTSGTTGRPKGVLWSRACEAIWARAYGDELFETVEGETAYCCLPLFHITCQGTALASLWRGGRVVIDSGFDPLTFWRRIRAADAVLFTYVGTILSILARRPRRPDDHENPVRRIVGAAAPADRWRDVEERFGVQILETYGQTETASCWMYPPRLPSTPGRVGRPSERFAAKVVAEEGREAAPGVPGELLIRPLQPHVMFEGYLGEASAGGTWTADGWYRTGDLMVRHPSGEFSFVGRLREAIRRRGEMIAAGEVELAALAHPAIVEAAAVGVSDDAGVEQEIRLFAVARHDAAVDAASLHRFLLDRLPAFMTPRYISIESSLPKTPSTRVQKFLLQERGVSGAWDARRPTAGPR